MSSSEANDKFSNDFQSYVFHTTAADTFLPPEDILLKSGPTWHGTALGWHTSFSSHVTKLQIVSSRFCGIKLQNEHIEIIAYTVYLPTSGQDDEFLEELSLLTHDILSNSTIKSIIIIGIDANCSIKSTNRRQDAFAAFKKELNLKTIVPGNSPTFHHNNGTSESQIDHILTNNMNIVTFNKQLCKNDDHENLSSHDAIIGTINMEYRISNDEVDYSDTYKDFRPKNIIWEEENQDYQNMTVKMIGELLSTYDLPEHLPALAEMFSNTIALCAEKCFKLKVSKKPQTKQTPKFSNTLQMAYAKHKKVCKEWRKAGRPAASNHPAKIAKKESQRQIQRLTREEEAHNAKLQHDDLMDTFQRNISEVCNKLKKIRGDKTKQTNIQQLDTFLGQYNGDNILEGFRANTEHLCSDKQDKDFSEKFLHQCTEDIQIISDISNSEPLTIPPITLQTLKNIIFKKLKLNKACDIYKLTTEHLRYAGDNLLSLLVILINRVIKDIHYLSAAEFKMSLASVIYKGKDKPKNHHKSYRLVRVCPLICRIIDEHIRPMAVEISKPNQSNNQYGFTDNISYLLGALQRHEAQKYCIDKKTTFFGCSLDGDSAFEVVSRIIQQRELYFSGETGQLSSYNSGCYKNTQTCIKMNGKTSQPLREELGVGQGKIRSSDHYKIYINPGLETLENSGLGVDIGPINTGLSCVADDLYLMSDDQVKLQGLLDISQHYGKLYRVKYGANKTVISVVGSKQDMKYYTDIQPWNMNNSPVSVKEDNDHLGLTVSGIREEEKNIDLKIRKARGSLFKLLGPAFSAKCLLSPALQMHLFRVYICPIARSGLAAMALKNTHIKPLIAFQRKIIRGFLRISDRSPIPSLYFLTGELPIEAKLHRDIFSLFYIIWNNPKSKISEILRFLMENSAPNSHTWARHIRILAEQYEIEDPLTAIQQAPPTKSEYKQYIITKITVHHERRLREIAATNSKMKYLNVNIKGLNGRPHPALQGVSKTNDIKKLRAHIKILCSDLYTSEVKAKYQGGSPHCTLCEGDSKNKTPIENIYHIVMVCNAYSHIRRRILHQVEIICAKIEGIKTIFSNSDSLCQFLLDCTSLNLSHRLPENSELCSRIFTLSRDLCYGIIKIRSEKLKKMNHCCLYYVKMLIPCYCNVRKTEITFIKGKI